MIDWLIDTKGIRTSRWGSAAIGDAGHEDHLGLEGSSHQVCVSDRQLPGNQSATAVTEVPAKGDVGAAQILAGVVEPDGEGNGLVLDEVLVLAVDVIDLGKGDGKGNLVWRQRGGV